MRRALAYGAALAALAIPATALAAAVTYEGHVKRDPKATVQLKLRTGPARAVKAVSVDGLQIQCSRNVNTRLGGATIKGTARLSRKGKFAIRGKEGKKTFAVRGKLKGKRVAVGSVRYQGPTLVGDRRLDCDSGKVRWRATR